MSRGYTIKRTAKQLPHNVEIFAEQSEGVLTFYWKIGNGHPYEVSLDTLVREGYYTKEEKPTWTFDLSYESDGKPFVGIPDEPFWSEAHRYVQFVIKRNDEVVLKVERAKCVTLSDPGLTELMSFLNA